MVVASAVTFVMLAVLVWVVVWMWRRAPLPRCRRRSRGRRRFSPVTEAGRPVLLLSARRRARRDTGIGGCLPRPTLPTGSTRHACNDRRARTAGHRPVPPPPRRLLLGTKPLGLLAVRFAGHKPPFHPALDPSPTGVAHPPDAPSGRLETGTSRSLPTQASSTSCGRRTLTSPSAARHHRRSSLSERRSRDHLAGRPDRSSSDDRRRRVDVG